MALRKAKPLPWSPYGASDTLDSSTSFPGAMSNLQNLIPDPSTDDLWQCRPAALLLNDLSTTFNTPTFISCTSVLCDRLCGLVSKPSIRGQDEPFCYNILTNSFTTISGVTAVNSPISPSQIGAWNPPVMTLVGSKIIVAHPGFTGGGCAFFGVLDTTNANALTWTAQNTIINALIAPPQWVSNFNGRCYFLVNPPNAQPGAYFSDVLLPTQITNANQVLTFGDNISLTCSGGLALFNQLGGIIQSLMVFKGVVNIYQITGDAALANLTLNTLNVATGTLSPNSLSATTKGLAFLAPDGVRIIGLNVCVSDPVGRSGRGITIPFFFSLVPSRANASFNGGVFRAQVQNGLALGSPQQEWWFDMVREEWSGPHTTQVSMIEPYANTFLTTSQGQGAKIYQSDQVQSNVSGFTEYGVNLTYVFQTSFLPNTDQMAQNCIIEATLNAALVAAFNITCAALDQNGVVLGLVTIAAVGAPTLWGQFIWGQALWQGAANALAPRQLLWKQPLVCQRLTLAFTGLAAAGIKLGRLNLRYQILGYLLGQPSSVPKLATIQATGTFTLNPNAVATVVAAPVTATSVVVLEPVTPDAGNDMATTSIVAPLRSFTLHHTNNPRLDPPFN